MSNILSDTQEATLLERLVDENPGLAKKFQPLFSEKVDIYIPQSILEDVVASFSSRSSTTIRTGSIASRECKGNNYLLKIDNLIGLYNQAWMKEQIIDMFVHEIVDPITGAKTRLSYIADFDVVVNPVDPDSSYQVFSALINREASFGFQKVEGIVYIKDSKNPKRFTQLVINEISRDEKDGDLGHYLVSCKNSLNDQLSHHVWLFPNMNRFQFLRLPGLFKDYVMSSGESDMPLFEWIEKTCNKNMEDAELEKLAEYPDNVRDDSSTITEIMNRAETTHYKTTIGQINRRIGTMFIPADIARRVGNDYPFQGQNIILPNKSLRLRTCGQIVELDIPRLKACVAQRYESDFHNNETNLRCMDDGKLKFSVLYDVHASRCEDPKKRQYSVLQLYVHRPSSTIEGEKFESYLDITNTQNPENRFTIKIDELQRYNGMGLYAVETFLFGKKLEHHLQIVEAKHDVMIDLDRVIRATVVRNGYVSAPEYHHIWKRIKER